MQYMENSSTEYTYSIRNPFKFPEKNPPVNPKEETVSDASALFGALFLDCMHFIVNVCCCYF